MHTPSKLCSLNMDLYYLFCFVTFLFHHEQLCCYVIVCSVFNSCVIVCFKPILFWIFDPFHFFTVIHGHAVWILVIKYIYTFLWFSLGKFPEVELLSFPKYCRMWCIFPSWGVLKHFTLTFKYEFERSGWGAF